jgi:hypothetical protein
MLPPSWNAAFESIDTIVINKSARSAGKFNLSPTIEQQLYLSYGKSTAHQIDRASLRLPLVIKPSRAEARVLELRLLFAPR